MRKRTRSREIALQMLALVDTRGAECLADIDDTLCMLYRLDHDGETWPQDIDEDLLRFARELVKGTLEMRPGIDKIISSAAQNMPISDMPTPNPTASTMAYWRHCCLPYFFQK